jgi:hypothetical protein
MYPRPENGISGDADHNCRTRLFVAQTDVMAFVNLFEKNDVPPHFDPHRKSIV